MQTQQVEGNSDVVARASNQTGRNGPSQSAENWRNITLRALGLIVLIAVWQFLAVMVANPDSLPGPWAVASQLGHLIAQEGFFPTLLISLRRVALGFIIAFALAIAIGILLGRSTIFERMFGAYVFLGITVPGLAYGVISIVLLGLNETAAVIAVVATIVPLMVLNVWEGTKAVDQNLMAMASAFRASRYRIVRDVFLPSLSPYLFAVLRLGFSLAWKIVVVVELIGLSSGVGYEINKAYNEYSMVAVLAWTLGFSIVMAALEFGIFRPIERHVLRWRP